MEICPKSPTVEFAKVVQIKYKASETEWAAVLPPVPMRGEKDEVAKLLKVLGLDAKQFWRN